MATRKRKEVVKKMPAFKLTMQQQDPDENDLKKVKARIMKELKEKEKNSREWLDQELDKNLKKQ